MKKSVPTKQNQSGRPVKDLYHEYDYFTGELTKLVRNLSFSGLGTIWIFSKTTTTHILPDILLWSLLCFVVTLFFDLLSHCYSAWRFKQVITQAEELGKTWDDYFCGWQKKWNTPKTAFRFLMVSLCILGYLLLIAFIIQEMS